MLAPDYRVAINANLVATLATTIPTVVRYDRNGPRVAGRFPGMRWLTVSVLVAVGCGQSPRQGDLGDAEVSAHDGATDVGPVCNPAEYDSGRDANLPPWS